MDCCKVKASDLRVKISIERKTRIDDGLGGFTEKWVEDPAGGLRAAVLGVGGQLVTGAEYYQYQRINPRNLIQIVIRFRGDQFGAPYYSSSTDRVIIRGRTYNIDAVYDPDFRRKWLQLNLAEGEPS